MRNNNEYKAPGSPRDEGPQQPGIDFMNATRPTEAEQLVTAAHCMILFINKQKT